MERGEEPAWLLLLKTEREKKQIAERMTNKDSFKIISGLAFSGSQHGHWERTLGFINYIRFRTSPFKVSYPALSPRRQPPTHTRDCLQTHPALAHGRFLFFLQSYRTSPFSEKKKHESCTQRRGPAACCPPCGCEGIAARRAPTSPAPFHEFQGPEQTRCEQNHFNHFTARFLHLAPSPAACREGAERAAPGG